MFQRIDKGSIEYFLEISKAFHPQKKQDCIRFNFTTREEFSYFEYKLSVDGEMKNRRIDIQLRGLKTTGILLPGVGQARGSLDFFDLEGKYKIHVYKQGQALNEFEITIKKKAIALNAPIKRSPRFLDISIT